ncbi:quinoprotein dehydrogenase-associated SoxYZ-like carrier [Rhodovulum tesquicola]|uniref:quinoprotein dehydrogenase-associated SoxYZ-like carrier n=1 Tax=Rhodovulum tesquicola TaxID=540254 RepID=UPI002098228B|nr:quinoprotein dehydrogenase-associated SoxYZ-like carrier [Rhodovulum tesquicola]MCO8143953.1 quinoprotein dehydrogenase-associated SoxYZ-like carrier [Rhodovulum tesquicola]
MRRLFLALALSLAAGPALAQTAWDELRPMLFPDHELIPAGPHIAITSPYRTEDDARTPIGVHVEGPEGRLIDRVTVVLDENPMPVSAVVELARPLPALFLDLTLRFNGATALHVVAETTDGGLFVAETHVKTSGQGACAAPPGSDPVAALADLGQMRIEMAPLAHAAPPTARLAALTTREGRIDIDIRHPSHSGLQKDQVSLLFIPPRYVETVAVALDGQPYATITGSISLSENPRIGLSAPGATRLVEVTMKDTSGTVTTASRQLPGY